MSQFDVKFLCRQCEATWEDFARKEEIDFPENKLILLTPKQINQAFKEGLDQSKLMAGLIPSEVYVSDKLDGKPSVHLGATLLKLEVFFQLPLNIRRISQKWRNKGKWFPFEQRVKDEYERCLKLYQQFSLELDLAWPAQCIPAGECARVMAFTEESFSRAFKKYTSIRSNRGLMSSQRKAMSEVVNLGAVLKKLRNINSRQP